MISEKCLPPALDRENLELTVTAVLEATVLHMRPRSSVHQVRAWSAVMETLSGSAHRCYRALAVHADLPAYTAWSSSPNFLSNVSMTLAKSDMDVAWQYVDALVAPELHHVCEMIRSETVVEVLTITGGRSCWLRARRAAPDAAGARALSGPPSPA